MSLEVKQKIESIIKGFSQDSLFNNSITLFKSLGYKTDRQNRLRKNSYTGFIQDFPIAEQKLNYKNALVDNWDSIELLFQLTQSEMTRQSFLFDTGKIDNTIIEAYLFFAIELKPRDEEYKRKELSDISREVNKVFSMPVMVLFKYENLLTLSVIKRRLHKKDENKDVLEKVTLIKDINIEEPHRAHIEILYDLSFDKLQSDFGFRNFVELHNAWQKTLDSSELNKRFYKELANWYFWAIDNVEFPDDIEKNREKRNSINVIRMLTRLIFVWFLKEKDNLIPDELFNKRKLDEILNYSDKTGSTYYKAILQNLFFATLNTEMNKDFNDSRTFIKRQFGVQEFYRYERFFTNKEKAIKLFENIPFLNGGLFENLDKNVGEENEVRIDCFSNNRKNEERLSVPDYLFFETEKQYDKLNKIYDTKGKKYIVRGLLEILNKYKFTIHENTPIEEEIALDPELLGKVFENLLASYNEETQTTARKLTGSFYTPREVVDYMVEESLISYLINILEEKGIHNSEAKIRDLFSYTVNEPNFTLNEKSTLIEAIDNCKILDPACGSGAFPMGILHKMVFILSKLDPHNDMWKQRQIDKVYEIPDTTLHENLKAEIEKAFNENYNDYGRKLYLIENCIYGVDIQPIAVQISKLRFFISLIVDQKVNKKSKNLGIRPLPNLETKFVAANSLVGIEKPTPNNVGYQLSMKNEQIGIVENKLRTVRERHFNARTPVTKKKYREKDKELRKELADLLTNDGFRPEATRLMTSWEPYDQNKFAGFFDSEWMFGLQQGFNVVVGNPPYVLLQDKVKDESQLKYFKTSYKVISYKVDLYHLFFEKGFNLLGNKGVLCLITPSNFLTNNYTDKLRKFILEETILNQIVNIEDNIFDASVNNAITLFTRAKSKTNKVKILRATLSHDEFKIQPLYSKSQSDFLKDKKALIVAVDNENVFDILINIETDSDELKKYALVNFGMQLRDRRLFPEDVLKDPKPNQISKFHKKCLAGSDINRYTVVYNNRYCYFNRVAQRGGSWDENVHFLKNKVLVRQIGAMPIAGLDEYGFAVLNSAFMISPKENIDGKFLLALINSKVLQFYWANKFGDKRKQFPKIKGTYLQLLPIKGIGYESIISLLVSYVLTSIKYENGYSTFFQNIIDGMVYEIYFTKSINATNTGIIDLIKKLVIDINEIKDIQDKLHAIEMVFTKLNESNNEVRNRIIKQNIAVEEAKLINQSLSKYANSTDTPEEL